MPKSFEEAAVAVDQMFVTEAGGESIMQLHRRCHVSDLKLGVQFSTLKVMIATARVTMPNATMVKMSTTLLPMAQWTPFVAISWIPHGTANALTQSIR